MHFSIYLDLLILRLYNLLSETQFSGNCNWYIKQSSITARRCQVFHHQRAIYILMKCFCFRCPVFAMTLVSTNLLAGEFAAWLFWFYGCADAMTYDDVLVSAWGLQHRQVRSVWQQPVIKSDKCLVLHVIQIFISVFVLF